MAIEFRKPDGKVNRMVPTDVVISLRTRERSWESKLAADGDSTAFRGAFIRMSLWPSFGGMK